MKKYFLYILILPGVSSCTKDVAIENSNYTCNYGLEFENVNNPGIISTGLIPLSLNNYWVYVDSTWDMNGTFINSTIDTIRPIHVKKTESDYWWYFNQVITSINLSNNEVFVSEYLWPSGCLNKRREYYSLTTDTIISHPIIEGDMGVQRKTYKIEDTIYTPAGNFPNSYYYEYTNWHSELIKENIGFIKITFYDTPLIKIRELTLIDYYLE